MDRYEVIEHMRQAHDRHPDTGYYCSREGMAAALDVVLNEVRTEINRTLAAQTTLPTDHVIAIANTVCGHFSKVKTAEEQVTITEMPTGWWVHAPDQKIYFAMHNGFRKENAETYRIGLIAQLKAGNQ